MGFGLGRKSHCPIGLDVGTRGVKLLQLSQAGAGWSVRSAALDAAAVGKDAVADTVKRLLDEGAFAGRQVVSSLPVDKLHYKNLRLPPMPADELKAAVEWETADRLGLNKDAYEIQYIPVGEVRQGEDVRQEIIVMAAPHKVVESHVATLVGCGLQPVAIDSVPTALSRSSGVLCDSQSAGRADVMLDLGYTSSKVVICRGGRVMFFKLIEVGVEAFDQALADQLDLGERDAEALLRGGDRQGTVDAEPGRPEDVDHAVHEALRPVVQELTRELGLCLRYYSVTFRGERPDRVDILGGEARLDLIVDMIAEHASLEARAVDPLENIACETGCEIDEPGPHRGHWSVAVGLSLRGSDRQLKRRAA